jgi:hypothetical protein
MIDGQQLPRTMKTYRQDHYEWDGLDIWAFASRLVHEWETEAASVAGEFGNPDDEKRIEAEAGAMRERIAQLKAESDQ